MDNTKPTISHTALETDVWISKQIEKLEAMPQTEAVQRSIVVLVDTRAMLEEAAAALLCASREMEELRRTRGV